MALSPKKGKKASMPMMGEEPDGDEASDSDDGKSEYKKLFVDAAKDGDWDAAFAAICSYVESL